ncbi:hypothetical protein PMZ80_008173 [Knufia obscura]|uniref:Uncharacterized protein n=1 Tax=Knufia obscura TaxID=1635080 RepID=A0ABR0RGP5_9EURO|nr:hypothetical protein PMZ80_008173 [Knufia obscura]
MSANNPSYSRQESDNPNISTHTKNLVLDAGLPDDIFRPFYQQAVCDATWANYPGGVPPLNKIVFQNVINELLQRPHEQVPHDAGQPALMAMLGELGYQLGYRIRTVALAPVGAHPADPEILKAADVEEEYPHKDIIEQLTDVEQSPLAIWHPPYENNARPGHYWFCVIPGCKIKAARQGIPGLNSI